MINQTLGGMAAEWGASGQVLPYGQWGIALDTGEMKIGDGLRQWSQLASLPVALIPTSSGWAYQVNGVVMFAIDANGRPQFPSKRCLVQTLAGLTNASNTAVHSAITLNASSTKTVTDCTNPDCYRALSIKGNASGISGNVVLVGTDYNGNPATDTIAASGSSVVSGVVPMATVTSATLPARHASGDTISIGTSNAFGLWTPVELAADVLTVERVALAAWAVLGLTTDYTVDLTHQTVTLGTVTNGDVVRITTQSRNL